MRSCGELPVGIEHLVRRPPASPVAKEGTGQRGEYRGFRRIVWNVKSCRVHRRCPILPDCRLVGLEGSMGTAYDQEAFRTVAGFGRPCAFLC